MKEWLALLLPLAWRNLWRNPQRTIITLLVVAVGLYSILCFSAFLDAWARSSRDTVLQLITGSGQIHAEGYLDNPGVSQRMPAPDKALRDALNMPAVDIWAPRVRIPAIVQSEYKTLPLTFVGVEPQREQHLSTIPQQIADGRYLQDNNDGSIVLGRHLAQRLQTRIGKRVIVLAQAANGALAQRSFIVAGLFAGNRDAEDQYTFTGIAVAQRMLGIGDDISEIAFNVPDQTQLGAAVDSLRQAAPALDIQPWTALSPFAAAMDSFLQAFIYLWLWTIFTFIAIGIANTQLMAVMERMREFGLLQALGMQPRQIVLEVAIGSAMLIGLGVLAGLLGAILTIFALHDGISLGFLTQGAEFLGIGRVLHPHIDMMQFVNLSIVIWLLGIVVALWPARRAATSNPVEALSHAT